MIALIDCNNFFVSCERIFRPDLEGKPVTVLSSNDGCAIARSNEVKALGIPMGAPAFKYKEIFRRHKIVKFSANFELYGNISRRITDILTSITPNIEVYSVDESFLDLSELPIKDYEEWGRDICRAVSQWVGVPVSIGVAPTKTLAKAAVHHAKKNPSARGVTVMNEHNIENILSSIQVADVWGVGYRNAPKLRGESITNALQLRNINPRYIQQMLGIQGRQMVAELNGNMCFNLQKEQKLPKSISRTRTFGQDITDRNIIRAALADFATRACFKLRESQQLTGRVSFFVASNRHKPNYRSHSSEICLSTPSNDTGRIISLLISRLDETLPSGIPAYRAGVFLHDFVPQEVQTSILEDSIPKTFNKSKQRMWSIDHINEVFGKDSVFYASKALGDGWQPRKGNSSPRYVSRWSELPKIKPI